ncbi:phage tail fiber domain-containing protein, partial [Klebsiella variicola]|uniref:phage tail fiber domain-containing protein n=1 Tax=Klebsiella variicola TaxID=244366 RepID=UPI001F5F059E
MSVPNQTPYNVYTANGLTTVFTFEFYIISADDLQVSINGGVVTSGYTVGGVGNKDGGDITFLTPPANGVVVMLERVVPTFRLTDYQDNGDLLADTVNKDFDRIWMAIQRAFIDLGFALTRPLFGGPFNARGYRIENLAEPVNDQDAATKKFVIENGKLNLARTLRVPESNVGILPTIAARKDSLFGWNSSGQPVPIFSMTQTADLAIKLASTEMGLGGNLVGIYDGRPPVVVTNTVTDKIKDGVAGLRKNFGAVGDGYHDDTAAFNDWWECLMDIAYKRRAYEGDEAAIKFMLQKGPLLTIENGAFIYDGPGLNIGNSDVFVFNVKGESALSTKILLPNDGVYLFDFDNNPVHSLLTDMTIHGGLGAVRFKSKSRNASSTHDFERLRLSRYN